MRAMLATEQAMHVSELISAVRAWRGEEALSLAIALVVVAEQAVEGDDASSAALARQFALAAKRLNHDARLTSRLDA